MKTIKMSTLVFLSSMLISAHSLAAAKEFHINYGGWNQITGQTILMDRRSADGSSFPSYTWSATFDDSPAGVNYVAAHGYNGCDNGWHNASKTFGGRANAEFSMPFLDNTLSCDIHLGGSVNGSANAARNNASTIATIHLRDFAWSSTADAYVGDNYTRTASAVYSGGSYGQPSISYASLDTSVCTVDATTGAVTNKYKLGTCQIKMTAGQTPGQSFTFNNATRVLNINVKANYGVTSSDGYVVGSLADNVPYHVLVTVQNGSHVDIPQAYQPTSRVYSAASPSVCTVTAAGQVTNKSVGYCKVTVAMDKGYGTQQVQWPVSAVQRSDAYQITDDSSGNAYPAGTRFSTETPKVCNVEEDGTLITRGPGDCIIRAYTAEGALIETNTWPIAADLDGDGWPDSRDNCPSVANANQYKTNPNATKGDACNDDWDLDGVKNNVDNCPYDANPDQAESIIAGIGAACFDDINGDQDGDGILDVHDNCPFIKNGPNDLVENQLTKVKETHWLSVGAGNGKFNADGSYNAAGSYIQKDTDGDGKGDACSDDWDGDTIPNTVDNCPLASNPNQADQNSDGVGDACERTFVKPLADGGNNNSNCGDSWDNACADVQKGIDAAQVLQRKQVFVQQGTYHPAATINLKKGIAVIGGFTGTELLPNQADGAKNPTIIRGDASGEGLIEAVADIPGTSNIGTLLKAATQGTTVADTIELIGLTLNASKSGNDAAALVVDNSRVLITGGQFVANSSTAAPSAAILVKNSANLEVRGSSFKRNRSTQGAAIYNNNSTVSLNSVDFVENDTVNNGAKGAAIYQTGTAATLVVKRGVFQANKASTGNLQGGAIAADAGSISLQNGVSFKENQAQEGGAIYLSGSASLTAQQAEFEANAADKAGAVSLNSNSATTHTIEQSLFVENTANTDNGGAIVASSANKLNFNNNTFFKNHADAGNGGALALSNTGANSLLHNTIVANTANTSGGVSVTTAGAILKGNLIAGNTAGSAANANFTSLNSSSEYNLLGAAGDAGVVGTLPANTVTPAEALNKIVADTLVLKGGDGYYNTLKTLPIVGGGAARDAIPANKCALAVDTRGEARPDKKSTDAGEAKCDIGAYEFTVLSCAEDAQRRYDQGEIFIKSCEPKLEKFELGVGSTSDYLLIFLTLLGLGRIYSKKKQGVIAG